jgi:hypothetical protein
MLVLLFLVCVSIIMGSVSYGVIGNVKYVKNNDIVSYMLEVLMLLVLLMLILLMLVMLLILLQLIVSVNILLVVTIH